jgi:DNA-binding Lrp family transcriptional regulator
MLEEAERVDDRDKRILRCLDRDARISLTDISKELKIPVTTIKFRIEKMMDEGVIRQFTTLFDPDVIGYRVFALITLEMERFLVDDIGKKMVDQLSRSLADEAAVQFAGITEEGDVRMVCVFKTMGDLREYSSELEAKSGVRKATYQVFDRVTKGRGIRAAL